VDELTYVDRILDAVSKRAPVIFSAHEELGIPLEDLICAAVRHAANEKAIDARQAELPLEGGKGK
jgi:hypothetical protein